MTGLAILSQDGSKITGMIGPAETDMMPTEGTVEGNKVTLVTRPRTGRTAAFAKSELTATVDRMTGTIDTDKGSIEFIRKQRPKPSQPPNSQSVRPFGAGPEHVTGNPRFICHRAALSIPTTTSDPISSPGRTTNPRLAGTAPALAVSALFVARLCPQDREAQHQQGTGWGIVRTGTTDDCRQNATRALPQMRRISNALARNNSTVSRQAQTRRAHVKT